jgi:hypothetical protein
MRRSELDAGNAVELDRSNLTMGSRSQRDALRSELIVVACTPSGLSP